jgi:hypothetical protein
MPMSWVNRPKGERGLGPSGYVPSAECPMGCFEPALTQLGPNLRSWGPDPKTVISSNEIGY